MKEGLEVALVHLDMKNRLVLPKRIRNKVEIRAGDVLFVYGFEKQVFLKKANIDRKQAIESIRRLGE